MEKSPVSNCRNRACAAQCAIVLALLAAAPRVSAGDWPTYRADAARSGYTAEALPAGLSLAWTYRAAHPPMPAWPTRGRLRYDVVCQPVIADGILFFGSSADGKVYALDATTGQPRWEFFTDGPVRFAPAVWHDRLFVASDDGFLYCLDAVDGRLLWKHRGGPRPDMLLGNDRMISRWPARGGPVVANDVVLFAAGIWPSEGIFVWALDPADGKVLWCNDSSGDLEMDQPHPTARAKSGIAAQGYLVVDGDRLLVPTGRAVPAALDRRTGKFLYFQLQSNMSLGGADVVSLGEWFFNGGALFDAADESLVGRAGIAAALHPNYLLLSGKTASLQALDRKKLAVPAQIIGRDGQPKKVHRLTAPLWTMALPEDAMLRQPERKGTEPPVGVTMRSTNWTDLPTAHQPGALIVAGNWAIIGGQDRLLAADLRTRTLVWSAKVEGAACGLAVANERLYASTDRGWIYCFASPKSEPALLHTSCDAAASSCPGGAFENSQRGHRAKHGRRWVTGQRDPAESPVGTIEARSKPTPQSSQSSLRDS